MSNFFKSLRKLVENVRRYGNYIFNGRFHEYRSHSIPTAILDENKFVSEYIILLYTPIESVNNNAANFLVNGKFAKWTFRHF